MTTFRQRLLTLGSLVLVLGLATGAGCKDEGFDDDPNDTYGVEDLAADEEVGKADNAGVAGPPASLDNGSTQVWAVTRQWEQKDSAAGMAWSASSGLNWDEKYAAWIQSMERTAGHDTYYDTFILKTPWGKTLPAPKLECAELAIFLRATFASWYNLPFYMTAVASGSTRVYFGHMGAVTSSGRYKDTPYYKSYYHDYTSDLAGQSNEYIVSHWPEDSKLRGRGLYGGQDDMPWLEGSGEQKAGHYFDEIFLNKRVGHFLRLLLSYFGSMHLASSRNTYNLKPASLRAGDVLLERWQRTGIGHTLVTKQVVPLEGGHLEAQLVSGSMPRRQPKWEDAAASKRYYTNNYCGGVGENSDGDLYAALGGGIKRWRVAKNKSGRWTNTWMEADEASWVCDTDRDRIAERPAEFDSILGEVDPAQLREALVRMIEDARNHLRQYPASCSARIRREEAFDELYQLNQTEFGVSRAQTDSTYRLLEDYVFAELEYTESKTCCWCTSTAAMYQIIMDYNRSLMETECQEPVVFKAMGGAYNIFEDYANQTGRGHLWRAWSEDEPCPQRDTDNDTEAQHEWIPWCEANGGSTPDPPSCTDGFEPNNNPGEAHATAEGSYPGLEICVDDEDYFDITVPSGSSHTVKIEFSHSEGDLDMALYQGTNQVETSQGTSDSETISTSDSGDYTVRVYGYNGAEAGYTLTVTID